MKSQFSLLLLLILFSCGETTNEHVEEIPIEENVSFDSKKWKVNRDGKYLYRDSLLISLIENDQIRSLKKEILLEQLGNPDFYRDDSSYLYYKITESKFGPISLNSKTLVIKLNDETKVEWMKIHE